MEALWERRSGTASELQKILYRDQKWAYSTVKTMLDRLVEKGFVRSRRVGNVYEYSPRLARKTAVGRALDDVVDRVLQGSVTPFIHHLVERRSMTREEMDELRNMLDEYEEPE